MKVVFCFFFLIAGFLFMSSSSPIEGAESKSLEKSAFCHIYIKDASGQALPKAKVKARFCDSFGNVSEIILTDKEGHVKMEWEDPNVSVCYFYVNEMTFKGNYKSGETYTLKAK